ncbi:MAG TPA: histidine kinase dimerization/phospho-acceptor domain-containing protein, partial [Usitatibacter sp.]|nr:histidine kinase dimerization/phospho-acceptor domain-containing protein [Usitatibacter sp.]
MDKLDTLDLCVALSAPAKRVEAARELARRCGVEDLLLFVLDPELGTLIPAPGFPQTLPGGPSWRAFLRQAAKPGRYEGEVEMPPGTFRKVLCIEPDCVAAMFLGGVPAADELALIERVLPMLCHALAAEQQARFAAAAAAAAHGTASRARSLADALEVARAEHARLNAQLHDEHRRKDDFLAMLAHELRNPLTPLVTSIELIRRADGLASTKQLEIMSRQVRQLSRLVEDLLDVSRVSR